MKVKQISVFLENKKGRLAQLTGILKENNIDISAISVADTANFGIIRMIVSRCDEAIRVIKDAGFTVNTADVLAIEVSDSPGGLHQVLDTLSKNDIEIEYLYSFVRRPSERALILFRIRKIEEAARILGHHNIKVLSPEEIYGL
ncbi:MAG TPA: ACT domain-containing protein [Clostridia bacterium]|nr:ACT domain-containing protein [Clostridia bacterium]